MDLPPTHTRIKRKREQNLTNQSGILVPKVDDAVNNMEVEVQEHDDAGGGPGGTNSDVVLNPLVLELIGAHLPTQDLTHLRDTCQLWNQLFTQGIITTDDDDSIRIELNGETQMKDFTEMMKTRTSTQNQIQFTNLVIHNLPSIPHHVLEPFYSVCCPTLTKLQLIFSVPFDQEGINMQICRQLIFEQTPNLVELVLQMNEPSHPAQGWNQKWNFGQEQQEQTEQPVAVVNELPKLRSFVFDTNQIVDTTFQKLLTDILENSSELESLSLKGAFPHFTYDRVLTTLRATMTAERLNKLKTLKMYRLNIDDIRLLSELTTMTTTGALRLKLQEFGTSLVYRDERDFTEMNQRLYSFLISQAPTLRKFKIKFDDLDTRTQIRVQLPHLPNLQHFEIDRRRVRSGIRSRRRGQILFRSDPCQKLFFDGHTLAVNFPSLTSFSYKYNRAFLRVATLALNSDMEHSHHDGITTLRLEDAVDNEALAILGPRFPSVSQLTVSLSKFALDSAQVTTDWRLWITWPMTLTTLRISLKSIPNRPDSPTSQIDLDELLTGIPRSNFLPLRRRLTAAAISESNSNPLTSTLGEVGTLLAQYKSKPGISDLKNLQSFVLEFSDEGWPYQITDICGYFGFATCPALQIVKLETLNGRKNPTIQQNLITPVCHQFIRNVLGPYVVMQL